MEGKTYLSTAVKGATLVPGTQIPLSFKDGSLSASGGCNSMGGTYTITGGRLTTTQMMTTEMGCEQPRMQQDQWLAALLSSSTINLAGDTLTLDDGTIQLTLQDREVADPDRPIEGTNWILDGIRTGEAVSSVPAGVTASHPDRRRADRSQRRLQCRLGRRPGHHGHTDIRSADDEQETLSGRDSRRGIGGHDGPDRHGPLRDRGGRPHHRRRLRRV